MTCPYCACSSWVRYKVYPESSQSMRCAKFPLQHLQLSCMGVMLSLRPVRSNLPAPSPDSIMRLMNISSDR